MGQHSQQMTKVPVGGSESLAIWLLGRFRLVIEGRAIDEAGWRVRKAKSLLKLLALSPHHRLRREQILDLLWPKMEPARACNNFHRALHVARRALDLISADGSACLRLERGFLTLCPDRAVWIDTEAFEAAADLADQSQDPAGYRAALALYAGDLLPEDRYEDWTASHRAALRQRHVSLFVALANLHETRCEQRLAIDTWQQALVVDPCLEEAHRGLMRLYALTGRRQLALRQFRALIGALQRDLDTYPDPESIQLHEDILEGHFPPLSSEAPQPGSTNLRLPAHASPPTNLTAQLTSFVGREREMAEIRRLLATTRLLTLIGVGGCGKTRLATETAHGLLSEYADGVLLVELASLTDPTLIPHAVASAVRAPEQPGRHMVATLAAYLASRRLLLILDNCEHLVVACANLAETLLRACPSLHIMATSREPLRIAGEVTWRVSSLTLPDPRKRVQPEELIRYEAAQLFSERVRAVLPDFTITTDNAAAVAHICFRLDGIPLALELAATRLNVLTVQQIATRLDDCMGLLKGGNRTTLTRQQTLQAALEWSYDLLAEPERALLRRLAVFAGGFTLAAAERVCRGDGIGAGEVLDLLGQLVDKSLVVADEQPRVLRFRLLEPIRQFAASRMHDIEEGARAHRQHLDWCVELVEWAGKRLWGSDHVACLQRMETEHDNLRAALGWARRHESESGLRLAGALGQFWLQRGYLVEGWQWLESLLDSAPELSPWRARALFGAWTLALRHYDYISAVQLVNQNVALQRRLGNGQETARALHHLGFQTWLGGATQGGYIILEESRMHSREMDLPLEHGLITHTLGVISASDGRYHEGRAFLEESLAQLREAGPQPGLLFPLVNLSWTPIVQDDRGQAQIWLWEEAMVLPRTINDQSAIGFVLANLGALARLEADYGRAGALLEESLEQFHRIGDQSGAAQALSQLGNLARVIGKYDQARMCLEESLALRRGIGDRLRIGLALCNLANLAAVEGNFEQAQTLSDSGHAIFQEARDKEAMIWAMHTKVYLAACRTDYAKATELLHEELALWRQWRDSTEQCGLATSLVNLGIVARLQGDYQKSRAQFEASLPPLRAMDSLRCLAVVLNELGNLLMNDQDYTAAGTTFTKSLEYARETLDDRGVAIALERLACHAAAQSDARRATRLAGAASRLRETIGGQMSAECKAEIAHYLRPARESLGEEVFATTWAEGRALTLDAAITEGDSIPEERHRSVTGPSTAE